MMAIMPCRSVIHLEISMELMPLPELGPGRGLRTWRTSPISGETRLPHGNVRMERPRRDTMYGARRDGAPAKLYSFCSALLCSCHHLKDLVVDSAHDRMCRCYPVSAMITTDKFLESPGGPRIVIDGGYLGCVPDTVSTGINTIMQYLHPPTTSQRPHCEHKIFHGKSKWRISR